MKIKKLSLETVVSASFQSEKCIVHYEVCSLLSMLCSFQWVVFSFLYDVDLASTGSPVGRMAFSAASVTTAGTVHQVFIMCTECLKQVYSRCTACVQHVYSMCILYSLPTALPGDNRVHEALCYYLGLVNYLVLLAPSQLTGVIRA